MLAVPARTTEMCYFIRDHTKVQSVCKYFFSYFRIFLFHYRTGHKSFWNIIIQRISHDDLTEKLLVSNFIGRPNLQIILEAKSMDEFSWKKSCYIILYSIFCSLSPFHREWLAFIQNNNGLDFLPKGKSKLVKIVANWGHSRWKQLNLQKIE